MELGILQWVVLAATGAVYGFTKTGIIGTSALAMPLMLCAFTPVQSIGIILPLLLFADIMALIILRGKVAWKYVLLGIPGTFVGIMLGWRVLAYSRTLPPETGDPLLKRIISAVMIFVVISGMALRWRNARKAKAATIANGGKPTGVKTAAPLTPSRIFFSSSVAFLGGVITSLANNSGAVWIVFLMQFNLEKNVFLGTGAWLFFFQNLVKLPFGLQLGFVNADSFRLSVGMVPMVALGMVLGRLVVGKVSQERFNNLTQTVALIAALYLLLF